MVDPIILTNNITVNLSGNNNFMSTCVLNQMQLLNQLEKMPKNLFILIVLSFVSLLVYAYVVPRLPESWWKDEVRAGFMYLSLGFLAFAMVLSASLTFALSERSWHDILYVVLLFAMLAVAFRINDNWEEIRGWLRRLREQ